VSKGKNRGGGESGTAAAALNGEQGGRVRQARELIAAISFSLFAAVHLLHVACVPLQNERAEMCSVKRQIVKNGKLLKYFLFSYNSIGSQQGF
jgi:hypothetical protein